jgi:hypothetical protein
MAKWYNEISINVAWRGISLAWREEINIRREAKIRRKPSALSAKALAAKALSWQLKERKPAQRRQPSRGINGSMYHRGCSQLLQLQRPISRWRENGVISFWLAYVGN